MEALYRYFSGAVAALVALTAPVAPLAWCVVCFIAFDFLTGIIASREAWHTVQKLALTSVALYMAYALDAVMLDFLNLHLTKLFAGFVCGVEMWSFLENACRISDAPLFRYLRRYVRHKVRKEVER